MNNTAILLSTCDKYSWAWPIWTKMFQRYWADNPFPTYFITNNLDAPSGACLRIMKVGNLDWSSGMIQTLKKIKEENIIFLLEDYWFTDKVNTQGLQELCHILDTSLVEHIRLYVSKQSKKIERKEFITGPLDILNYKEDYRCSLNAGIWKRQTLLDLLKEGEDIWTAEHGMTNRSRDKLFCTVREMKYIIYNIDNNMIEKGKLTKHGKEYIRQENVNLSK